MGAYNIFTSFVEQVQNTNLENVINKIPTTPSNLLTGTGEWNTQINGYY